MADMKGWIQGMRDSFFDALFTEARKNRDIILVTSDTGAICHDEFREELPGQYINVGIAEQNMIGVAAGLAMSGKTVFCYAIVPFATLRCLEQIRVDLCCMELPVNIVGVGCGYDYSTLGPTHHGTEDISVTKAMAGLSVYSPCDSLSSVILAGYAASNPGPKYIRIDRTGLPPVYTEQDNKICFSEGISKIREGADAIIISTGRMVYNSLRIASRLEKEGMNCAVADMCKISPIDYKANLKNILKGYVKLITLEEHYLTGGIGSSLAEFLADEKLDMDLLRIGIPDCFCRVYGQREDLLNASGLDDESIIEQIKNRYS